MPRSIDSRSPAFAMHLQVVHAAGDWRGHCKPICARNSCPARSAAQRRPCTSGDSRVATPSASNADGTETMRQNGNRRCRTSPGDRVPALSSRKLALRYSAPPDTAPSNADQQATRHLRTNGTGTSPVGSYCRGSSRSSVRCAACGRPHRPVPSSDAANATLYQLSRCMAIASPAISAQPMLCEVPRSPPRKPCELAYTLIEGIGIDRCAVRNCRSADRCRDRPVRWPAPGRWHVAHRCPTDASRRTRAGWWPSARHRPARRRHRPR